MNHSNTSHVRRVGLLTFSILLFVALVFSPLFNLRAQTETDPPIDTDEFVDDVGRTEAPPNTVSCFDYYSFGSVQADFSPSVENAVSGTPIAFRGSLKNANSYPIVDGALYVKVFKKRGSVNDGNGPDVVDQFLVKGDIAIPAKGTAPLSFMWNIPSYALSGEYELATFFTTSRKFNLLGLSFTDDVVGNRVPFSVIGEQDGGVQFDKTAVSINGDPYYFAAFPPRVSATEQATVEAVVRNDTSNAQAATVSWTAYQWDGQLRENVVQESEEKIMIPAGGSVPVGISISDTNYPVYYVVGTLVWNDTKSIIGARFVREGVNRVRINFPGIQSFPLVAGQANTLFSCLHDSGVAPTLENGRLDLTLSDYAGNEIHAYSYTGAVTGAMMGVADSFMPDKSYDYLRLNARLYQNGEFVDEASLVYDCNAIDPSLCLPAVEPGFVFTSMQSLAVMGLSIVLLIIVLWLYRRIVKPTNPPEIA